MAPDQVRQAIRADIINGRYQPGQRVTEETLAEQYGVSRVPVREALRALVAEGFLVSRPYVGTFVAELTEAEAEDLLTIRALLEPLCAVRAAENRTPEQLGRLKELLRLGDESIAGGRLEELTRLNSRFHEVLAEASGSTLLSSLLWQMSQKIAWVYSAELPRRADKSWAEHAAICAAVEDQDAERARSLMEQHIAAATVAYGSRRHKQGPA
ncbi:GntR family transcriptional regulator [Promicromonospora soli]